jgi:hypothetical protein
VRECGGAGVRKRTQFGAAEVPAPAPVAVRYGWAENPPVTLYAAASMPASQFRSDAWHGQAAGLREAAPPARLAP